jgi:hypothetical protein
MKGNASWVEVLAGAVVVEYFELEGHLLVTLRRNLGLASNTLTLRYFPTEDVHRSKFEPSCTRPKTPNQLNRLIILGACSKRFKRQTKLGKKHKNNEDERTNSIVDKI